MANYAPILLQLCRYCLWVNDITGFCPASVRMTLAYTILSPHFLLPHLWSSNYSRFMDQQCHMEAMASSYRQCQSSRGMWLWPVRDCNCTSHRCWKQHWGGFIRPDKDAKPPCAVFRDESPLTFSTDKKESQAKYACKHSHSCVLPLW